MSYVLENRQEFKRLEDQAKQKDYSLKDELRYLNINSGPNILDAGCGSGVLSRYFIDNFDTEINLEACDVSTERIQQAREYCQKNNYPQIKFSTQNLEKTSFGANTFDVVVSRYVIEHLSRPLLVLNEFKRVLKEGGQVYLIDLDGIFVNFYTSNNVFNEMLSTLTEQLPVDFFIGRKLAPMLTEIGFKNVQWRITTHNFQGEEFEKEYENNRIRCELIHPYLINIFKNEKIVNEFKRNYLNELRNPTNTHFHNKFIVWGNK
jgi:ubiquinone/menaquinone biosynthesis C-methylase UbiE